MHFISTRHDLFYAISTVQRAVMLKSPQPILSGIKFDAESDSLTVTATDMEIGIKCSVPVRVIEQGKSVLPSKYITELIRRLPDMPITFIEDQSKGSVTISYGDSEININSFPADEYPDIILLDNYESSIEIQEDIFRDALRKVLFAVAKDDNRASLTGALLSVKRDCIELVATDLHRLAWNRLPIKDTGMDNIKVIIPGKTLSELSKIIGKQDSFVKITILESQVLFSMDNISFISRLLNGKYPKYSKVIPNKFLTKIKLKAKELLEATERAALFSTEDKSSIKFEIKENILSISDIAIAGRVYEEIPASLIGDPTKIGFNAYYLNDLLKALNYEEIEIELSGPFSPCIFRPVNDSGYFSLILPVRITTE